MYEMTDEEFESAIQDALDLIPDRFLEALNNVVIVMENEPNDYHLSTFEEDENAGAVYGDELLGLFDGLNILERRYGDEDEMPDVITVFKGPHERSFDTREQMVEEIEKTIIHEVGHYFGLEDDRLYEMGY